MLLVEGAARPGYRPLRDTISELSLGPRGWIQTANFLVFGLLFIVFSRGVKASVNDSRATRLRNAVVGRRRRRAWLRPVPSRALAAFVDSLSGVLHLLCAIVLAFALLPVATGVMARAFSADAHWRSLGRMTRLTSS